jgi:hypothetical protein
VQSLQVQAEIIAAAAAASSAGPLGMIDADQLAASQTDPPVGQGDPVDQDFALNPERIAPMVRRLVSPTNTRANFFDRDGLLVLSSRHLDLTAGDGVSGFSRDGAGVSGTSQKHNGVVGRTGVVNASGVYGENSRDPFADQDVERGRGDAMFGQPIDWQIVGVMGRANSAAGTGVKGASSNGDGVTGIGGRYGAVLGGQVAPVRLSPAAHPGAPTSGYHRMGELYVDNEGDLFFCKKSGTPGIWKQVA